MPFNCPINRRFKGTKIQRDKERKRQRVEESKRQRDKEIKRGRVKETKRQRDKVIKKKGKDKLLCLQRETAHYG